MGTATLLLDIVTWDLVLDASNNIAAATAPYALAQDAASAEQTFKGEVYYDTTIGVDYDQILGKSPSLPLLKSRLVNQALTVPGVVSAKAIIAAILGRGLKGQVQVKDADGNTAVANFSVLATTGIG